MFRSSLRSLLYYQGGNTRATRTVVKLLLHISIFKGGFLSFCSRLLISTCRYYLLVSTWNWEFPFSPDCLTECQGSHFRSVHAVHNLFKVDKLNTRKSTVVIFLTTFVFLWINQSLYSVDYLCDNEKCLARCLLLIFCSIWQSFCGIEDKYSSKCNH